MVLLGLWILGEITSLTGVLQWRNTLFRKDGKGRQREGVALYVREQLDYMELCSGIGEEPMESLWIRIKGRTGKSDIIVSACFRPLDQEKQADEALEKQIGVASHAQQAERGDPSSLLNTCKAMPGVLHPVLGIPIREMNTLDD